MVVTPTNFKWVEQRVLEPQTHHYKAQTGAVVLQREFLPHQMEDLELQRHRNSNANSESEQERQTAEKETAFENQSVKKIDKGQFENVENKASTLLKLLDLAKLTFLYANSTRFQSFWQRECAS